MNLVGSFGLIFKISSGRVATTATINCLSSKLIHSPLDGIHRIGDGEGCSGNCAQPSSSSLDLPMPAAQVCSRHGLRGSWNIDNPCEESIQLAFEVNLLGRRLE